MAWYYSHLLHHGAVITRLQKYLVGIVTDKNKEHYGCIRIPFITRDYNFV